MSKDQPTKKAIKLLVSGFEASGKSTITSQIKDALIINFDGKIYNIPNTISADYREYKGVAGVANFINSKISAYKNAYGKLPEFVVLDTITSLYSMMTNYNAKTYKGFEIFKANEIDTLMINDYLEDTLISNGISVIIVAHAKWDETKNCYVIPAEGQFKNRGSWYSYVNDSVFIDKTNNKRTVFVKSLKFPARSTIYGIEDRNQEEISVPSNGYDINKHIAELFETQSNNTAIKL